jgi:hypothetical protein
MVIIRESDSEGVFLQFLPWAPPLSVKSIFIALNGMDPLMRLSISTRCLISPLLRAIAIPQAVVVPIAIVIV